MRWLLGCLGLVSLALLQPAIARKAQPQATVAPTSTVTLTIKINVPEILTVSYTCATPDPSGDGSCDIASNAPVGTSVLTFKITGAPSAYAGTPTFTESTNSFKLSGNSVVTAVSPLTAASYSATIVGSQ